MSASPRFLANGDTVMVVEFGETIDLETSGHVTALTTRINSLALNGITDLVPTFRSLAIHYDPRYLAFDTLKATVRMALPDLKVDHHSKREWLIPTCYDPQMSPDLTEVAERCSLSIEEVINLHSQVAYHVYMIGFLPGFPYLGDLASEISLPRKETPSLRVPERSVAIAERMTAIYPNECPGGWYAIGRTPMTFFDPLNNPPALLAPGDQVRFKPIKRDEFDHLADKNEHLVGHDAMDLPT